MAFFSGSVPRTLWSCSLSEVAIRDKFRPGSRAPKRPCHEYGLKEESDESLVIRIQSEAINLIHVLMDISGKYEYEEQRGEPTDFRAVFLEEHQRNS